jgi:hypothetical protein
MTERWQGRVRDLSRVEAPVDGMWARVAEGPRPERGPSRRHRSAVIATAFLVSATGAFLAWFALLPGSRIPPAAGGTEAIVRVQTPTQTGGAPAATLSNGIDSVTAALDVYEWNGESHREPFPPDVPGSLAVVRGTKLQITGDDTPDRISVFLADPNTFAGIPDTAGVLNAVAASIFDREPGEYVLVVQESWGCHFESPSATSCFATGAASQHPSLLTFYFGVTIVG